MYKRQDLSITISDDYDGGLPDNVLGNSNTLKFGDPVYFLTHQKVGDVTENMTEYAGTYMGNMPDGDLIIATGIDPESGTDISYEGASGSCLFNKEGKIVGNVYAGLNTDLYERPDDRAKNLKTTGEIIGLSSGSVSYTHLDVYKRQAKSAVVGAQDKAVLANRPASEFVAHEYGNKLRIG